MLLRSKCFRSVLAFLLILAAAVSLRTVPAAAASLELSSLAGLAEDAGEEAAFSNKNWKKYFTSKDLKFLSCVIYCETEPLGYEARVALGNVVLNRMNSTTDWGHVNTIEEVIFDTKWGRQFDCAAPKKKLKNKSMMDRAYPLYDAVRKGETEGYEPWQIKGMTECIEVAKDVMCGKKAVPDSFVFCRGAKYIEIDRASCMETDRRYLIIESHIYYEN